MSDREVGIDSGYSEVFPSDVLVGEDLPSRVEMWTSDTDVSVVGVFLSSGLWYISQVVGLNYHHGSGRTPEESINELSYVLETHFDIVDRINGEG